MVRGTALGALVGVAALTGMASGETRGTLRFGVLPLDLESSSETPLFGEQVDRVVDRYNAAAAAFDRSNGGTTTRIDSGDLGVAETLLVIAPGLEFGGGRYFFRLEAPIGIGDDLKSVGVGVYPLNLQARLRRGLTAYVSAGGTASWLDRPGSGDVGGLVVLRGAAGVRLASHFIVEVGYSAFALGGTVNNERLESMAIVEGMELIRPDEAISAGEAHGIVDVSLGVTF